MNVYQNEILKKVKFVYLRGMRNSKCKNRNKTTNVLHIRWWKKIDSDKKKKS